VFRPLNCGELSNSDFAPSSPGSWSFPRSSAS
jgi:hypothetical protein